MAENIVESKPKWTWNGKDWSVSERPGSAFTRQFYLRVKDTAGKWRYALATSLSVEEFNRRFAGRRGVTRRRLKPVRKSDYAQFKVSVFEDWRANR